MYGFGVRQSTTTTGTGALTLAAVTGYPTFADVFATDERFYYSIVDDADKPLEAGIGYLDGTGALVRERVLETFVSPTYSRDAPAAVNLGAGTKFVISAIGAICTLPLLPPHPNTLPAANEKILWPANVRDLVAEALTASSANRGFFVPVCYPYGGKVDAFVINAGGALNADFSLYVIDPNTFMPGSIFVSVANAALAGGWNFVSFTAKVLKPGWYYAFLNLSSTAVTTTNRTMHLMPCGAPGIHGTELRDYTGIVQNPLTQGTVPTAPAPTGDAAFNGTSNEGHKWPAFGLRMV